MKFQLNSSAWIEDLGSSVALRIKRPSVCQCVVQGLSPITRVWQAHTYDCDSCELVQHDPVCPCIQQQLKALGLAEKDLKSFEQFTLKLAAIAVQKVDHEMLEVALKDVEGFGFIKLHEVVYQFLDFVTRFNYYALIRRFGEFSNEAQAAWWRSFDPLFLLPDFEFMLEDVGIC